MSVESKLVDAPAPTRSGDQTTGDILHLPDAMEKYPGAGLLIYNRVSSWGQAGKGKVKLEEKTDGGVGEYIKLGHRKLRMIIRGIEEGKLSAPRPTLIEAAKEAGRRGCILVAGDLSRFIRSESYNRRRNKDAWPTPEEFARFHEMTLGVPCATLARPAMTESERHSRATKLTKKAGRPRKLDHQLYMRIFDELGSRSSDGNWDTSIASVARRLKIAPARIQRLLDSPVPERIAGYRPGQRWKDVRNPGRAYRRAWSQKQFPDQE